MTLYRETRCEHDYIDPHMVTRTQRCPGGSREEVVIDYEAAAQRVAKLRQIEHTPNHYETDQNWDQNWSRDIVDAALRTEKETVSTV